VGLLDTTPVWVALNLVWAVVGLSALAFGLRLAVTRRVPRLLLRLGVPEEVRPPPQFVRHGGSLAFYAAGLLLLQAAFLLPVPRPARLALSGAAILLNLVGIGWWAVRRD
jgi:hypothetical protein